MGTHFYQGGKIGKFFNRTLLVEAALLWHLGGEGLEAILECEKVGKERDSSKTLRGGRKRGK